MAHVITHLKNMNVNGKLLRVTLLKTGAEGARSIVPLYDEAIETRDLPCKKQTRGYKRAGKKTRKVAARGIRMLDIYLTLHERSNKKKKNGWARDIFRNSIKAMRKSD